MKHLFLFAGLLVSFCSLQAQESFPGSTTEDKQHIITPKVSPKTLQAIKASDALVALWDFSEPGGTSRKAVGRDEFPLSEQNGTVARADEGPISGYSAVFGEGSYLSLPNSETGALNIVSPGVTVIAWVKREHQQIGFIAGMWNEYEDGGKRQYGLFVSLPHYNGADQVCGHISRNGGPTPPFPYSIDYSASAQTVEMEKWCCVGFTYDGRYIKSYLDGEFVPREEELINNTKGFEGYPEGLRQSKNPYYYPDGMGDNGSDFTVGAVLLQSGMGNLFKGNIGGVAVFDRALTDAEMAEYSRMESDSGDSPDSISGIYPRLAYYNNEEECGTGAVVPWAGSLWAITYGPHLPNGSSDKLYEVTPDFRQIVHEESIGGTPANRMVHAESNQLFIGPYAIDKEKNVRAIPYTTMSGRHTGNARHLTDPANKILYGTMEEGFYEVDVKTLEVKELYRDGNNKEQKKNDADAGPINASLPGVHGKGFYSGQGVAVYSNNGEDTEEAMRQFDVEAGALAEWNGKDWKVVRRNQFVEVTGPGGIYGNANPETDPIWATGWDHKSVILAVRDAKKGWSFFRLPKASHSYDGAHGWNTEWPRIRNIGTESQPDYLMTMHGLFWRFPATFTADNSAGIRPRSAYLKVIGDFTRWNDGLVFGCDDSAQKEFLNKRKAKGNIEGPGQSNSNLWFTSLTKPDELGPATAEGAVWAKESVKANEASEPFLFSGWSSRHGWIKNEGKQQVTFTFEVDEAGNNAWKTLKSVTVEPGKAASITFIAQDKGEWIRVKTDKNTQATVSFNYAMTDSRSTTSSPIFAGLTAVEENTLTGGLLYGLGDNRRALGLLANTTVNGKTTETGYYEMGDELKLVKREDTKTADFIRTKFAIPQQVVTIDAGSVLIVDELGRRWRLPLGNEAYKALTNEGVLRLCREVATERDLFSCMGTFYELPAENADGFAKIRPVSTHNYRINDYASYRGMLVLTGVTPKAGERNEHIVLSDDGKAAVWVGVIDDLWTLGKPVGQGGPWKDSEVKAGVASDPYLIAFYDQKRLTLQSEQATMITVEVDPTGNGDWMEYAVYTMKAGEKLTQLLPESFEARWVRFISNTDTKVTAWLDYR